MLFFSLAAVLLLCGASNGAAKGGKRHSKTTTGIDVSHHQGVIDWKKVSADKKVEFVYIKATEGGSWIDQQYKYNIKEARKAGLKVGSYHFFRMTSTPQAQFANFKKTVKKGEQDLIPMIDVETTDGRSPKEVRRNLQVFIDSVVAFYGVKPMIYSMMRHYNDILSPTYNRYHLYIGRYGTRSKGALPPVIKGKGTYTIWQYTECGRVSGIRKPVDLCRFHSTHTLSEISMPKPKRKELQDSTSTASL